MPAQRLKTFLDQQRVKYITLHHSPAYTAQEIAAAAHVSGREMAKTVVVWLDGRLALAVLPANRNVVLEDLRIAAGAQQAWRATEEEFQQRFPDCEPGAMPPFGNLYDMEVYAAETLAEDARIAFNAGSHSELLQMSWADFERLAKPKVAPFST
jgi:Ala-tRNA(Pro) deacylase